MADARVPSGHPSTPRGSVQPPHSPAPAIDLLSDLHRRSRPLDPDHGQRGEWLEATVRLLQDYLDALDRQPACHPSTTQGASGWTAPARDPRSIEEVLDQLRQVTRTGVTTTSARHVGYVPAGGLFAAALAGLVGGVLNPYSALHRVNPGAVELEQSVIDWMIGELGLPAGAGGVLTSGGSTATLTAVVAARDHAGILGHDSRRAVVYSTQDAHHTLEKALHVAGLGAVRRHLVGMDATRRMDPTALAEAVAADRRQGLRPWLLVGTAGTVHTGSVDPLAALADLAAAEGLWFHVDGAYGGLYALCAEGRAVLDGLERADSLVVDPHKTLFLPYGTGALLVRDAGLLLSSFAADADYLDRRPAGEHGPPPSPADLSIELTRPFRGLALWLALHTSGTDALRAALSEKLLLARYAHAQLARSPHVATGPPPELGIVLFRPQARQPEHQEELTTDVLARLQQDGRIFLTPTRLDGELWLRIAVGSFRTHRQDVDAVVRAVLDAIPQAPAPQTSSSRRTITLPAGHASPRPRLRLRVARERADERAARRCELEILGRWYGDTAEDLAEAYGDYEQTTTFLVLEHADDGVVGFARMIGPGPRLIKTLADIEKPPWTVDGLAAGAAAGMDPAQIWDIATIGLHPDVRDNPMIGTHGRAAAIALYHTTLALPLANGSPWATAILDRRVRALIARSGTIMHDLPGTTARPYMGSPACAPVYADLPRLFEERARRAPLVHQTFSLEHGGSAVSVPTPEDLVVPGQVITASPVPHPTS